MASAQKWEMSPGGQHIELGIAENNLFLLLAVLGLSGPLFGVRLLPIGTLYDPFICRGLDALNYACYQGAKFLLVATPSGISLAPEGGAHQSVITPLIGIGQPGMTAFEPAFVDELAVIVAWALGHIQDDDGSSVYLRLSTRPVNQPAADDRRIAIRHRPRRLLVGSPGPGAETGGCLLRRRHAPSRRGARPDSRGYPRGRAAGGDFGRPAPRGLAGRRPRAGPPARRKPVRTSKPCWHALCPGAALVTVLDGHPATLSWLGAVARHRVVALGVDRFGQSGDIPDLYREYGLDSQAIIDAAARACLDQ